MRSIARGAMRMRWRAMALRHPFRLYLIPRHAGRDPGERIARAERIERQRVLGRLVARGLRVHE